MAADKLSIYNDALAALGERNIASLTENREPRRVLDQFWTPTVNYCLEQGFWKHAKRVIEAPALANVVPQFGYNCAIALPNDLIRIYVGSATPVLNPPLLDYKDEAGYIFSNVDPLYLAYISGDPMYGWNLGRWQNSFTQYVVARLARKAWKIAKSAQVLKILVEEERKARMVAKANDAMSDPPGFSPTSTWVRARRGAMWGSGGDQGTGSASGGSINMGPG